MQSLDRKISLGAEFTLSVLNITIFSIFEKLISARKLCSLFLARTLAEGLNEELKEEPKDKRDGIFPVSV